MLRVWRIHCNEWHGWHQNMLESMYWEICKILQNPFIWYMLHLCKCHMCIKITNNIRLGLHMSHKWMMLYGFIHLLVSPFWSRIDGFSKLAGRELCQPDGTWYKGCKCHVYTAAKIAQVNVQKEDQFPEQAKKTSPGARGHVRHGDCGDISKPAMRVRSYSVYSIFSLHQPGKSPAKLPENWWRFSFTTHQLHFWKLSLIPIHHLTLGGIVLGSFCASKGSVMIVIVSESCLKIWQDVLPKINSF